jgi:dipeptidyl aminopeptidase/acylaminoacyl peptidase
MLNIDANRIGILGRSAGGYLALMAGCCLGIKAQAIVSYYGYGDIVGDWYAKSDPYYLQQPLVSEADARATVGTKERSEADGTDGPDRFLFYLYCRQQGRWPAEILGVDHLKQPEAFYPYCPIRNITADYPPTLLLHGTADSDVPYEQSTMMADALRQAGVAHKLVSMEGDGHTFDNKVKEVHLENGEHAREVAALYQVVQWFGKYVAGSIDDQSRSR